MTTADNTILFSGVVVTCNDALRLKECLESLFFCDQIVVIDLNSSDGSDLIAKSCGAEVFTHERVPIVEMIREVSFGYARHPWIIHIDPDEIFPRERLQEVLHIVKSSDVALIRLPCRFYFRNKPLKGTVWGGENSRQCVYHRDRIVLSKKVHVGTRPLGVFTEVRLIDSRKGAISHYWVDSYRQMFDKHMRYIKREGAVKYGAGERFTWHKWISQTLLAFRDSLITHNGWADSITGVLLSIFYAWYVSMSYLSLRNYQRLLQQKRRNL